MRAEALAALVLVCAALPSRGMNEGHHVTFGANSRALFPVAALKEGSQEVFFSGPSDPIPEEWDTVLIQGELPDPSVSFQVSRPAPFKGPGWQELEIHRFEGGRFWAKAEMPRGSGPLSLRAMNKGAQSPHHVEIYGVEVFTNEPEISLPAPLPRNPAATSPLVIKREAWRAAAPRDPWTPDPLRWRITLHHTDGRYTRSLEESKMEARLIQDSHMRGRNWNDIGYHFLIDPLGNILQGRPEDVLGAHTLSNNEGNIGISLLGSYHHPKNDPPTVAQFEALIALGQYLIKRYGVDPVSLKGHRNYKTTDCPGELAYAYLDELRGCLAGVALNLCPKPAPLPSRPDIALLKPASFD